MALRPAPYDVVEASRRVWNERWDPEAASGVAVFTAILRTHQILMRQVQDVLKQHGLTFGRYEILAWLHVEPGSSLSLSWISDVLRIPPATVTGLIDRLVADGFIRRVGHPTDARTTLAELTESGRRLVEATTEQLNADVYRPLNLSPTERDDVIALLCVLRERSGEFDVDRSVELIDRLAGDNSSASAGAGAASDAAGDAAERVTPRPRAVPTGQER